MRISDIRQRREQLRTSNPIAARLLRRSAWLSWPHTLLVAGGAGVLTLALAVLLRVNRSLELYRMLQAVTLLAALLPGFVTTALTAIFVAQDRGSPTFDLVRLTGIHTRRVVSGYLLAASCRARGWLALSAGMLAVFVCEPLLDFFLPDPWFGSVNDDPAFHAVQVFVHLLAGVSIWGGSRIALVIGVRAGLLRQGPGAASTAAVLQTLVALLVTLGVALLMFSIFDGFRQAIFLLFVFIGLAAPYFVAYVLAEDMVEEAAARGW